MKKLKSWFLIGCIVLLFSCQSSLEQTGDFKLLPIPQEFEVTGTSTLKKDDIQYYFSPIAELPVLVDIMSNIKATDQQENAQIVFGIDSTLDVPAEGYTLEIAKRKINLKGKDKAGLFYAFKTLEQLIEDADEQGVHLPICNIIDFPLLSYRAVHLDVKHHLEKTEYYYRLMDRLSGYKVNGIIVEMEDKLKYERQPMVGSADALSINEWQKLSNYAKDRNIEISPLIQGLGHASFILKHEQYKNLRDDPESDWAFNPLDPITYEVQFDLYLDAIEATPHGKYLHIGGDEVHTTGRGSGQSALELQLLWLNKVCKFAEAHNRIPIFWDDMPLKQAGVYRPMFDTKLTQQEVDKVWEENEHKLLEFLDQFPKNCIYMRWNYSSPQAIGNGKAMRWFRDHGLQVMGATAGQTRWVLMPQQESNMENIKSFAVSSINNDLNGLLLTLWDDDSPHFELYMRGIIAFSEYAWSGAQRTKEEIKMAYRQREFSNSLAASEFAFIDQLEQPVAFWKNALLTGNKRNYLQDLEDPINQAVINFPDRNKKGEWGLQYAERLEQAAEILQSCKIIAAKIDTMKSKAVKNLYTLEVYEQVNQMAQFPPRALLALNAFDVAQNEQQELDALRNLEQLSEDFKVLRTQLELVYGKTRVLSKPDDYLLDQDQHHHLANQTISFDWQFVPEILFLQKVEEKYTQWNIYQNIP